MKSAKFWAGPSGFNGEPIVAVAGQSRENPKIRGMVELTILPSDGDVTGMRREGRDAATCGNCPRRPHSVCEARARIGLNLRKMGFNARNSKRLAKAVTPSGCYVNCKMLQIMGGALQRGGYDAQPLELPSEYFLRLTRFGCITALPIHVAWKLFDGAKGWTGYTGEWRTCDQHWRHVLMASCTSMEEAREADAMGWRAYISLPKGHPHPKTAGSRKVAKCREFDCASCLLCSGVSGRGKCHVSITEHGVSA